MNRRQTGARGEELAAQYLRKKGYDIRERNWRLRPDEIDIVALDGDTWVFVEVKTRTGERFGSPAESIGPRKLHSLRRSAAAYLQRHGALDKNARYDVIEVRLDADGKPAINHIQNAFEHGV